MSVALTAAIASQLVAAMIVDHFGLFGVRVEPVTLGKVVGVALVIAGAVVVQRGELRTCLSIKPYPGGGRGPVALRCIGETMPPTHPYRASLTW